MVKQSQIDAKNRYEEKTYTVVTVRLRKDEDKDLIKTYIDARENGMTSREWVRSLYENEGE